MANEVTVRVDNFEFDDLQLFFVRKLCESLKTDLEAADILGDEIAELTGLLAFNVSCLIDGSTIVEKDGERIMPFLTFARNDSRTELLAAAHCTSLHEYALGTAEEIFEDEM